MTRIYDGTNGYNLGSFDLENLWANVFVNANIDGTSDMAYGVSSLTDVGTGKIGVNFTMPFINSDFVAIARVQRANAAVTFQYLVQDTANLGTTRTDFAYLDGFGGSTDPTEWNICVYGRN